MTLDYLTRERGGTRLTKGLINKRTSARATSQGRQAASKDWKSGKASLVGTQPC